MTTISYANWSSTDAKWIRWNCVYVDHFDEMMNVMIWSRFHDATTIFLSIPIVSRIHSFPSSLPSLHLGRAFCHLSISIRSQCPSGHRFHWHLSAERIHRWGLGVSKVRMSVRPMPCPRGVSVAAHIQVLDVSSLVPTPRRPVQRLLSFHFLCAPRECVSVSARTPVSVAPTIEFHVLPDRWLSPCSTPGQIRVFLLFWEMGGNWGSINTVVAQATALRLFTCFCVFVMTVRARTLAIVIEKWTIDVFKEFRGRQHCRSLQLIQFLCLCLHAPRISMEHFYSFRQLWNGAPARIVI